MEIVVILTFVLGYMAIVFEHPLKLDKTIPALAMAAICWALLSIFNLNLYDHHGNMIMNTVDECHNRDSVLLHHIGKTSEILVFLIGAMTIVELVDLHGGFSAITDRIKTNKKSTMLWLVSIMAFFLSAVLDNLTCVIVIVSLLRRLVPNREERVFYVSMAVIAANAGGAWSPIGDVTTTMLWIGNKVTSVGLVLGLFLPSVVCAFLPVFIVSRLPLMRGNIAVPEGHDGVSQHKKGKGANLMLIMGVSGLLFVPIFKSLTHLPPYVGMMISLAVVWFVSERIQPDEEFEDKHKYSAHNALSRIEMSSILFFLGILMAVASLESLHILANLATALDSALPKATEFLPGVTGLDIVVVILGFSSAVIDNVPLVAAAMGMYLGDAKEYLIDSKLWQFLAYSAGTGGSMLIIGSAAGVAAMGMEKIDFMWYLRNIAWIALIGFIAGAIVFLMLNPMVQPILDEMNAHAVPVKH
jgi:Na+/H+ antiporter NhaD/arsenite permease-like protein